MTSGIYTRNKELENKRIAILGSVETRLKMRKARIGKTPWNKGIKTGKNLGMSIRMKGKISNMKGKKHSDISKDKMRKSATGIHLKENNGNWKGGTTLLGFQIRNCVRYSQWRSDVFARDRYFCQKCGVTKCKIEAHHIKMFSLIMKENNIKSFEEVIECEELWNINNGITLCKICHKLENSKQMKNNNYAIKDTNA